MRSVATLFTEAERDRIRKAVEDAERSTSGEIVPVVAQESGHYARTEDAAGFVFALLVLAGVWLAVQEARPATDWSARTHEVTLGLAHVLVILMAAFALGVMATRQWWLLRHAITRRSQMKFHVEAAAERVFFKRHIRATHGGTGILIYISLFERMVRVLGDETIAAKLTDSDWEGVRDAILVGFRDGKACDGLCEGIARCGQVLAAHFPPQPDAGDELPNDLVIVDGVTGDAIQRR